MEEVQLVPTKYELKELADPHPRKSSYRHESEKTTANSRHH